MMDTKQAPTSHTCYQRQGSVASLVVISEGPPQRVCMSIVRWSNVHNGPHRHDTI